MLISEFASESNSKSDRNSLCWFEYCTVPVPYVNYLILTPREYFLIFHRDNYVPGTSPVSIFRYFTNTYVFFVQYYTMRKIEKNKRFSKDRLGETTLTYKSRLNYRLSHPENCVRYGTGTLVFFSLFFLVVKFLWKKFPDLRTYSTALIQYCINFLSGNVMNYFQCRIWSTSKIKQRSVPLRYGTVQL